MLNSLPAIAPHTKLAARLQRSLRKINRAAGRVRDLDVQNALLSPHTKLTSRSQVALERREGAVALLEALAARREHAAEKLTKALAKRQTEVAARLEALAKALEPSLNVRVPTTAVLAAAVGSFAPESKARKTKKRARPESDVAGALLALSDSRLHDLRKAAKTVRYLAESVPQSERGAALASRFRSLQDAGGEWHDWLELTAEARRILGRKHPLTADLASTCKRHHAGFLHSLRSVLSAAIP